jgi:16S rRNA (uracil1498-N3)-methyltransferase
VSAGEVVEVFDGRGYATLARVISVDSDWVELTAVGTPRPERVAPCRITLASAVPKGNHFDWLVEKATEVGVDRFVPLLTDRSIVEPGSGKLARLCRSIIEASKQCGRNRLMILESPVRWSDLVGTCADSRRFIADCSGTPVGPATAIPRGTPVILAVGPEGGFTDHEQALAQKSGWVPINLGVNTLRIETAGVIGCACLFMQAEESIV